MAFDVYGASESTGKGESKTDWNALNEYVVETADLKERTTVVGYISAIVDLGTQKMPDAEKPFKGTAEEEAAAIAEKPATYFKDGYDPETKKPCRLMCWPQKDQQCVAFAVDFPDIIIDKGQFFGESKPLPLRMWLGGECYMGADVGRVIQRPQPLKVTKELGTWSFSPKAMPYKAALAAKIIKSGEAFEPKRIDELLGKAFQFEVQIFMKPGKDGKQYYTEYVRYVGALGRGMKEPEQLTKPFIVMFNQKPEIDVTKELRSHVINTMKQASNYNGSKISEVLGEAKAPQKPAEEEKPKEIAKPMSKPVSPAVEDQDCPF